MLLPRRCAAGRQRPGHRYADGSTPVHHPPAPYWSCRPTPADSGRLYRRSRETRRQREYRAAAAAPPARSPPAFCHCRQRSGYQPPPPAPARARLLPPQLIAEANHPLTRPYSQESGSSRRHSGDSPDQMRAIIRRIASYAAGRTRPYAPAGHGAFRAPRSARLQPPRFHQPAQWSTDGER